MAQSQGLGEGVDLAGRVDEQCHLVAHALPHEQHVGDLALHVLRGESPPVDLEGLVSHLVAPLGEVGELLGRREPAVLVAVQCRGIRAQGLSPAAEELVERLLVQFACDIPQADIDDAHARHVVVAQAAFDVVVDPLPFQGILAEQVPGAHLHLFRRGAAHTRILTGDALVGVYLQYVATPCRAVPGHVHHVERVVVRAHILERELECRQFDLSDLRICRHCSCRLSLACDRSQFNLALPPARPIDPPP